MSACSGGLVLFWVNLGLNIFWCNLGNIFWGNHHNNPHNSLLWPITQTRRVARSQKKQPSQVQRPDTHGGESLVDVLVGDVVGGEGAAVGVGGIDGLPRHLTLHGSSLARLYCTSGLPGCVCRTFCAHNSLFDQSWCSSSSTVVPSCLQRPRV